MERQEKKEMKGKIWGRAQKYADEVDATDKVVCAFDYYAGAQSELVLVLEWKNVEDECPDTDRQVLTKDENGCYRVAYCDGGRWSEEGVKCWREIHELD
jgi:hypothetical protein